MSSPGYKGGGRPTLNVDTRTHVDVDPYMTDAFWLRRYAGNLTKREHVNPPFPEGGKFPIDKGWEMELLLTEAVFDVETALNSEIRLLFTLAEVDEL